MARPEPDLAGVQRWMLQLIVQADGAASAASGEDRERAPRTSTDAAATVSQPDMESILLPSRTLSAAERLQIYRDMYPLRMQEALASDYPALLHFLGEDRFARLVQGYVSVHPSRSYTLNRLGDHFPEYVSHAPGLPRPAFCADLARLELAIAQVFDEAESPALDGEAVAGLGEAVADLRLRPIDAFRLLSFRYPVDAYLQSVRGEEHDHPRLAQKPTWVAVFRRDYSVRHLSLSREQHALLSELTSGATLGEAVIRTSRAARRKLDADEFFRWFRDWVGARMFRAIDPVLT
jgi:hypothetical protein